MLLCEIEFVWSDIAQNQVTYDFLCALKKNAKVSWVKSKTAF